MGRHYIVLHQLRAFDARGFHAAILITGNYGGIEREMRLLCDYYRRRSGTPLELYCIADWECIRLEDYRGDHAGICETQQLMALRTEPSPVSGAWGGTQFPDSRRRVPVREIGERIVASQIECFGRVAKGLLERYSPVSGWTAPSQNEVDDSGTGSRG